MFSAGSITSMEDSYTQRINELCYKLEHYTFLSTADRAKLRSELDALVKRRNQLRETLSKKQEE